MSEADNAQKTERYGRRRTDRFGSGLRRQRPRSWRLLASAGSYRLPMGMDVTGSLHAALTASMGVLVALLVYLLQSLGARRQSAPKGTTTPTESVVTWLVALVLGFAIWRCTQALGAVEVSNRDLVVIRVALAAGLLTAVLLPLRKEVAGRAGRRGVPIRAAAGVILAGFAAALAAGGLGADPRDALGGRDVVWNTCLTGGCGLKQRQGPGPRYAEAGPRLPDGTQVRVLCTVTGDAPPGATSHVWALLGSDLWVSDEYIDRPRGGRPPYLPTCPEGG